MPAPVRHPSDGAAALLAYLTLCVVWGSTFLAIRIGIETIPPWTMIGGRCLLAGLMLTGFALLRGARLPGPKALGSAVLTGVLLFSCSQSLMAWGELRLPSGQSAVLACTVSLFTPAVSWLLGAGERPKPLAVLGLVVGFVGVAVLANPGGHGAGSHAADRWAAGAILLSSLAWAFGAAIARRVPPAGSAILGSGLQLLAGCPAALACAWARGEWTHLDAHAVSGRSIFAMLYLVVMGSVVAFACFGWLVQIWSPARLSTYAFINPVVALLLGSLLVGEAFGARDAVAALLILAAVALVMQGNRGRGGAARARRKMPAIVCKLEVAET